jgi:homoserine kinase
VRQFRSGPVRVRVPATSANLGPGFDAVGLALALYDEVSGTVSGSGLSVEVTGEGANDVPRDESHLVLRAMRAAFDRFGAQPPGLSLHCTNRIPHERGLGSSAAAIVAGVVLARGMVDGGDQLLDDQAVLALCADLEGHPDNVAACLLGGLTIAWLERGRAVAWRGSSAAELRVVALVPPFGSSTEAGRKTLPSAVPHSDAAFTAGRAALLIAALTASPELLFAATEDRLHQPYRVEAMPATAGLLARLRSDGLPAVLSGAGPAVLVLAGSSAEMSRALAHAPPQWEARALAVDSSGAAMIESGAAARPTAYRG